LIFIGRNLVEKVLTQTVQTIQTVDAVGLSGASVCFAPGQLFASLKLTGDFVAEK
jgi:hypothetical protein